MESYEQIWESIVEAAGEVRARQYLKWLERLVFDETKRQRDGLTVSQRYQLAAQQLDLLIETDKRMMLTAPARKTGGRHG